MLKKILETEIISGTPVQKIESQTECVQGDLSTSFRKRQLFPRSLDRRQKPHAVPTQQLS